MISKLLISKTKRGICPLFLNIPVRLFSHLLITIIILLETIVYSLPAKEPTEIIVKFTPETQIIYSDDGVMSISSNSFNKTTIGHYFSKVEKFYGNKSNLNLPQFKNIFKLVPRKSQDICAIIDDIKKNINVIWIEPNYSFKIHYEPNDSLYLKQWHLHNISMSSAWDVEQGSSNVVVGIIDTGIDYKHPDLIGQIWINNLEDLNGNGKLDSEDINYIDDDSNGYVDDVIGWDFTHAPNFPDNGDYLNPDNDPMDEYPGGHGTPVAGIVAAKTNNYIGISGIAPNVKVMALRAGTSSGFLEEDDVAEAIIYAVQNGCRIINMSFGDVVYSHLVKDAVDYGTEKEVLFVTSAGNSANDILQYPAAYDETISVGATDEMNNLASFSSYGSKIDLVAPGNEILSTIIGDEYGKFNGTSFAAPIVSGVLSLIISQDNNASSEKIKSRLLSNCNDLGLYGWDIYFGHGLVDPYHSLINNGSIHIKIDFPSTQSGVKDNYVPIIGTAAGYDMKSYELAYGIGNNPTEWSVFQTGYEQKINDTLGIWNTQSLPDTIYTLELAINKWDFTKTVHRVCVYLDNTPPQIERMHEIHMMIKNTSGYLLEIDTDDQVIATLYYKNIGESAFNQSKKSGYFGNSHNFLLTQDELDGEIEYYYELINTSGIISEIDNDGYFYRINLSEENNFNQNFIVQENIAGTGYYLNREVDFNNDGLRDIVGNLSWPNNIMPMIFCVNYNNGIFIKYPGPISAFGRDVFDIDNDSYPELLAGYGSTSYLFPGLGLPNFSIEPIVCGQQDFWAARIFDFENDGHFEIAAISANNWNIFQLDDYNNFSVSLRQTLINPTSGDNSYGVPYAEIVDINQNGKPNLILGDYDGDLLIYEQNEAGEILPITNIRLPGIDATHRFGTGDFDGDKIPEIVIATQKLAEYIGESSVERQYWNLSILEWDEIDSLITVWEKNFYGVVSQKNIYSGITIADYDGDDFDEIFFTPFPDVYYIQFQNEQYQLNWYETGFNSNAVPKVGNSQFLITKDTLFSIYEIEAENLRPLVPTNLKPQSADTSHISLIWKSYNDINLFEIERQLTENHEIERFTVTDVFFYDTTIIAGGIYSYKIRSIDSTYINPNSSWSDQILVRAQNPPTLKAFTVENDKQLTLEFSDLLGEPSFEINNFLLRPDSIKPLTAIKSRGRNQILLSFLKSLEPGEYELLMFNLFDQYFVPFYSDTFLYPFVVESSVNSPYVRKVEMISKRNLLITFNHGMDPNSVENIGNYFIDPDDRVVLAKMDSLENHKVYLYLTGQNRMGSLGVDYFLEVRGLYDSHGQAIPHDYGNRFLIRKLMYDLQNIIVYPNPYRVGENSQELTFGNLPWGCEIFIYTANGQKVVNLKNEGSSGGVEWDLRNQYGQMVESGVYLYIVKLDEEKKVGKFMVLR